MPGFSDSFWSADYAAGLGVLFGKLQQGVIENEQVLTIARMRAEAEETYARKLADILPAVDRMTDGFARDDGASLRKAYEGVRGEMDAAAQNHKKIAANISELVVQPFGRWCDAHETRVQSSHDDLQARIRAHDKQADVVRKLRSAYFNKCRQLEDVEEENKMGFQAPDKTESSPKTNSMPTIKLPEEQPEEPEPIEIGDETYAPEQVKKLLTDILTSIPVGETKVAILGTYLNVSTGSDIVDWVQKNLGATSVSYAERIGQDLVSNGFLRLVGNVGSTFANSSRMYYQWRPKVFQITGLPEKRGISRVGSTTSNGDSPIMGSMGEVLQTWNPLNNPYPNETPLERFKRESREADEKYKAGVRKLDALRCSLEEAIVDHLKFMERCELDRLKAMKAVMLDFSGSLSNVIPGLQSTVDNMMLYQETIQPTADLRYMLENYRTGSYIPKVQVYDNYYNNIDEQIFGVDLEARARLDRKRVPIVVTSILQFLDSHYPDLEGDQARQGIWLVDVPLAASHHLRNSINSSKNVQREILEQYEVPIVASVLKLYLLELPDSLVSSQLYEVIKTIYGSPDSSTNDSTRVSVLQNALGQLRLANIATLDAITTHFTRLIELTSADETFVATLAQSLSPCVLRPKLENSLTMHERHPYRLVRDLFEHKDEIFGELKRASSQNLTSRHSLKDQRPRAISSTDESNRRANMEARTRAIVSRSRASSPAPPTTGSRHRRDRSTGGPESRFPVVASPSAEHAPRRQNRHSLEVPDGSPTALRNAERAGEQDTPTKTTAGGSEHADSSSNGYGESAEAKGIEKKNSLTRSARAVHRKTPGSLSGGGLGMISRSAAGNRDSAGSQPDAQQAQESEHHRGVELTDGPSNFQES